MKQLIAQYTILVYGDGETVDISDEDEIAAAFGEAEVLVRRLLSDFHVEGVDDE